MSAWSPQRTGRPWSYIDAGFTGFTVGNPMLPRVASIGLAGEVLRLLG
jgi:hypothetical protein